MDILDLLAGDQELVIYRKSLRPLCGSVTASILMSQLIYWSNKSEWETFYKFIQPCEHKAYKKGKSWCEELGFSYEEFTNAFSKIGVKFKSKTDWASANTDDLMFWAYSDKQSGLTYWGCNRDVLSRKVSELSGGGAITVIRESRITELGKVELQTLGLPKSYITENTIETNKEKDVGIPTFKEAKSENETNVFEENEVPVIRGYPKTFAMSKKNAGSSKLSGSLNDSDMDIEEHRVDVDDSACADRFKARKGIGLYNGSSSLTRQSSAFYGNPENEGEYMEEGNARGIKVDRMTFENEVISQLKKAVKHNDLVAICGDLGMVDIQDLLRAFAEDFASGKGKEKNLVFRDKSKTNDYRYNSSVKGVGMYFKKWVASVSPEKLISDGKVTVDFSKEDELAKKLRDFCLSPAYGHKQNRNYKKRPESGIKEDLETVKSWLRDGWKEDDIVKLVCVFTWTTGNDYTYPRLTVSPKELRYLWKDLDVQNTFNPEKNERIRSHYNYYYKNK